MTIKTFTLLILPFLLITNTAHADWILDRENSTLTYGSIKKNSIGESNHFRHMEGRVTEQGDITLLIDLTSVETWVDIRNERMKEFFFETRQFPLAILHGQVNMTEFTSLKIGEQKMIDMDFEFDFHGTQQNIDAELIIIRLTENKIIALPNDVIFLDMAKFDLLSGLKKLQQLAKLPSIATTVPITFHLTFNQIP